MLMQGRAVLHLRGQRGLTAPRQQYWATPASAAVAADQVRRRRVLEARGVSPVVAVVAVVALSRQAQQRRAATVPTALLSS